MPGIKGRPWGNALGGYKLQKRVGGRFVSGKTGGLRASIHNARRTRADRTRWNRRAAIAGGAVVGLAAIAGGAYMIKSGKGRNLIQQVHAGQPKLITVSGPEKRDALNRIVPYGFGPVVPDQPIRSNLALRRGAADAMSALKGSGIPETVTATGKVKVALRKTPKHLQAMLTPNPASKTPKLDQALHGAKAARNIAGATAATAVAARVTVGSVRETIKPTKPHVVGPRPGGRPKGSTKVKSAAKEGAKVAREVAKPTHKPKPQKSEFVSKNTPEYEAKVKARILADTPEAAIARRRKRKAS